jgi:hypothetical protein
VFTICVSKARDITQLRDVGGSLGARAVECARCRKKALCEGMKAPFEDRARDCVRMRLSALWGEVKEAWDARS